MHAGVVHDGVVVDEAPATVLSHRHVDVVEAVRSLGGTVDCCREICVAPALASQLRGVLDETPPVLLGFIGHIVAGGHALARPCPRRTAAVVVCACRLFGVGEGDRCVGALNGIVTWLARWNLWDRGLG